MRHKFQSIKDKGGLKIHLDGSKPIHRGFGYKTFKILRFAKLNVTSMAKAFDVTFDTMKEWQKIDDREMAERKAQHETTVDELNDS